MPLSFTGGEKRRLAWLTLKAAKQSMAVSLGDDAIDPRLKAEVERIEKRAEDRGNREAQALEKRLNEARNAAASAKTTMRTSKGQDRAAARQQMNDHEAAARRIERELRRYQ
jgi:hypothetical protein